MKYIDINCDMGELPEHVSGGTQESLMPYLTSVNIACGGHAGDDDMMRATIQQAMRRQVAIGAHPGYADRAHFGRIELHLTPEEIADSVFDQITTLARIAASCSVTIGHVKPHGALYNQAAQDRQIAQAIARGVARWRSDVVMVCLAASRMLGAFSEAGFPVAAEAYADRRYEPDGSLRSRKFGDSLLTDPAEAAAQAVRIAESGTVIASNGATIPVHAQTICIHGDTPGAIQIAAAVAASLRHAGITPRALTAAPLRS
jgi:UPF0271 protein